jgi:hypothetical protein
LQEGKSIFDDRRNRHERRQQSLSMPAGLNRRKTTRRHRRFSARDWWLDTDYAIELVGESKVESNPDEKSGAKSHPLEKPKKPSL